MSYQAYQKIQEAVETPSQVEYRLFAKVTAALRDIADKPNTDPAVVKALDWNRRMWSTFASDCGATGNQLPKETRASIISLSLFVSKHSSQVIRGKAKVEALISINKTIMEGLARQSQLQLEQQQQVPANEPRPMPVDHTS